MSRLVGKWILIVDDEELLRDVLSRIFIQQGALVEVAENGRVAFEMLQKKRFDAVLSDARMPNGDGVALAKDIQTKLSRKPKIFICSGFNDIKPEDMKALGIEAILEKPFKTHELIGTIANAL
jgi:CheY-like chemotaxis protein